MQLGRQNRFTILSVADDNASDFMSLHARTFVRRVVGCGFSAARNLINESLFY